MKLYLLIFCLFIFHSVFCQKISEADSLLRQKYYHRVFPKAINSINNFLYDGIDNAMVMEYPDEASKKLHYLVKTHNGIIFETDSGYITIPKNTGRAFISVFMLTDHDTILLGKKEFTVLNVPIPTLKIGKSIVKDLAAIDRQDFFRGDSLKVYFTDDLEYSDNWCKVEYFNIGYVFGGKYFSVDNKGPMLSGKTLDFIAKLKFNQEIVIKVMSVDCSHIFKHLPLVRFKIR